MSPLRKLKRRVSGKEPERLMPPHVA